MSAATGAPFARALEVSPLREWLATRSDAELIELLRRRPDLALPTPGDLATLAARAVVRSSVQRAVDRLDAFALRLLATVVAADDDGDSSAAAIAARVPDVDPEIVRARLSDLIALALVRPEPNGAELVPVGPVGPALGADRQQLGRPAHAAFAGASDAQVMPVLRTLGLPGQLQPAAAGAIAATLSDPDRLGPVLAQAPESARDILARLAGSPLATVPAGALRLQRDPDSGQTSYATEPALTWLLHHGLLAPLDERTVELPAEVARAVRAGTHGSGRDDAPEPPVIAIADRGDVDGLGTDIDALGTTAALEVLRWVDALAVEWTRAPAPVLRSGGLGVREMRRTAKAIGVSEQNTALIVEIAAFAGLVGSANGMDPTFLPTKAYDTWADRDPADRWTELARAWLTMTREPSLIGRRDGRDKVVTALGFDAERGTAPALRADVLTTLATLPVGAGAADPNEVLARWAWSAPRRAAPARELAHAVLREAATLGVTAAGGLTSYGRAAVAASTGTGGTHGWDEVTDRLAAALPEPVDTVLVQPDLTVVVPGQPVSDLGRELALVADLESSGGAAVYRVSEATLRRAFDAGRSGADLLEFFTTRSSTPVPQALRYQIEDLDRRYGNLRAGAATAYLRCDDVELLARVVSDPGSRTLGLRALAPTVAISTVSPAALLEGLRRAGFAPAAESPTGTVLSLDDEPPRAPARRGTRPVRTSSLTDEQLAEAVRRLRSGEELAALRSVHDAAVPAVPGVTSASMLETIREAIQSSSPLWLGYVDDAGGNLARTIWPISMAGGQVRGYGQDDRLESFHVHRIVAARRLEADD